MRRIITAILSTITTLVLLLSYHTSTDSLTVAASPVVQTPASSGSTSQASESPSSPTGSTTSSPSTSPSTSSKTDPSVSPTAPTAAAATTHTGEAVDTQWGPVQVRITVQGGKITASEAVQYPQSNGKDVQINGYALPVLNQEVIQAQSASIDTVSGATVTSEGYLQSLQSAIDEAQL
jgi:uncharacterized protein with FMN-binding domain